MKMLFFLGILCYFLQLVTINAVLPDPYFKISRLNLSSSGTFGPDSVLLDRFRQGPYVGVADGRILKYNGTDFVDFAYLSPNRTKELCDGTTDKNLGPTCGRALGLTYDSSTGNFYAVGAYGGLYRIGPNGGQATLLSNQSTFLSGIDYDRYRTAVVFTSPSVTYTYRNVIDGVPLPPGDSTGRLFKYDITSGLVTVVSENLPGAGPMKAWAGPGAGGPAVSHDGTCVMYSSSNTNQIFKYYLVGPKAGQTESLLKLPGYPIKIKKAPTLGLFWVAVNVVVSEQPRVIQPFGYEFSQFGLVTIIKNFTKEYPNTQVNVVQEYFDLPGAKMYVGSRTAGYVWIYQTLIP